MLCDTPVQVYDVWPFTVGPFIQSGLVPLVLAPIWVLYVYLQPFMDNLWPGVSPCNFPDTFLPSCSLIGSVAFHDSDGTCFQQVTLPGWGPALIFYVGSAG